MNVRRNLPQRRRSLIGAWCFLDHYGPELVSESGGMRVARHPHTGLATVSLLFTGGISHLDSARYPRFGPYPEGQPAPLPAPALPTVRMRPCG